MAIPETINVGVARRRGANLFAMVVARFLADHGANVLSWVVSLTGEISMAVQMGGGAVRVFEFSGAAATQPATQAAVLARFDLLEAHVDG